VSRAVSGLEIRINATNQALQPHAGGVIRSWSKPIAGEIRFDQGIGARNPDTGIFIWYHLAGAYDSNVALVLADGTTREENYRRMAEILRRIELRGDDLHTNLDVHYGLIQWFLGRGVMAEPNTGFMQSYLAAIGALALLASDVDIDRALRELLARASDPDHKQVLAAKQTLLQRPIEMLLAKPHLLGGFLGRFDGELWTASSGDAADPSALRFTANPVRFLDQLYYFLDLEDRPGEPASEKIWDHDGEILNSALAFYDEVEARTGAVSAAELETLFGGAENEDLSGGDAALWQQCVAAHRGFQAGLEILLLIPRIGLRSEFLAVTVNEELQPVFPARFTDSDETTRCTRALAPPPLAASDEIVTPSGGTFYAREAPDLPALVEVGSHFEVGQPLFIIEVMKMFNKVVASFSGTVVRNEMEGREGTVVKKGDTIFKIEPDEQPEVVDEAEIAAQRERVTLELLGA
jgi:biotin carboxyl carrier protein